MTRPQGGAPLPPGRSPVLSRARQQSVVGLFPLVCATLAIAADWDRFRGPNGSGVNETANLPVEFGPANNVVWKAPLPPGHSSPVFWGTRLYVTAEDSEQLYTYCFHRASGDILWRRASPRVRKEKLHKLNHAASPTPSVEGGMVYSFFPDFGLIAYTHDGLERWRTPLGPFHNVYGIGVSPILTDDSVILVVDHGRDSWIAAFRKENGKLQWERKREYALSGHVTPILWQPPQGALQVLAPGSFRLESYEASTGQTKWWFDGLPGEMKSVPVIDGDTLYVHGFNTPENDPGRLIQVPPFADVVATHDADKDGFLSRNESPTNHSRGNFPFLDLDTNGKLDAGEWASYQRTMRSENAMLAIHIGGEGDRSAEGLRWKYQRSIPQLPSPLLYRGVLYMINESGILTTLDPATGTAHKQARLRGASDQYYASPIASDGKIFVASHSGVVHVLKAGADQELLAANEMGEEIMATPAIGDSRLYVRTRSTLYAFGKP
jgi:outer membrane protein assembly factor BamB